jgi:signal transduction histidine kinase
MTSILIVDDEEGLQTSLVTAFAVEGYHAAGAGSGSEALRIIRQETFDVALVDLRMPGMDGIALMKRMREVTPATVVILMTAGTTVESAVQALKGGASDYILKPFRLSEIFSAVERSLELKRLRQENVHLNELNRRLQEIDQIKSNLLAAITHEFRTPLTLMSGYLDLLLDEHAGPLSMKQRESLTPVSRATVRLGRLISNLLVFVGSEGGGQGAGRLPVDVGDLLSDVVSELGAEREERQVAIRTELPRGLLPVLANADRLRLLFFNLVENAIKFTHPSSEVLIQARQDAESLLVTIRNTQGEIAAEQLGGVLQPFTQGDMSATRAARGLGLGLAVARRIAAEHGGELLIESGRGQGTTVRVRLPLSR